MYFPIDAKTIRRNYMQWIATFTMCLLGIQSGLTIGWASPNLARYIKNESDIYLTPDEITWVSSVKDLAGLSGALLGPLGVQFFGSKMTSLISFFYFFLAWGCITMANNFILLMIGRVLMGISNISSFIAIAIYMGEISSPENRGTLISIVVAGSTPGIVIAAYMEAHYSSTICSTIYLTGCLVGMSLLIFVLPESPYFLVKKINIERTKKSISAYFPDEDVTKKLLNIQNFVKSQGDNSIRGKFREIFGSAHTRKLMLLTIVIASLTTGSGMTTVQRYLQTILERANSYVIDPENALAYINVGSFAMRVATCNFADKFGRKFLFIWSGVLVSSCSLIVGVYFFLLHSNFEMEGYGWVPVTSIAALKIFHAVGFGSGLFLIFGELCPPSAKNVSNCVSYLCVSLVSFVMTKLYLPMSYEFGEEYIFLVHAISSVMVIPVVIFLLPESRGKQLEDI